jgi:preprotein translocase subunit SecG
MENILLIVHLMIALALVVVILLQRSEGGALGMGGSAGGGGMGMFSARGAASALTRATAILAICFIGTSLGLAILAGGERHSESIFDSSAPAASEQAPAEDGGPVIPTTE